MICPVVAYAPKAATKPSIAAQPLNFSASCVMVVFEIRSTYKEKMLHCEFLLTSFDYEI